MTATSRVLNGSAGRSRAEYGQARIGIVSATDVLTGTTRVLIQPDGVLTGWLPVLSPWVGPGWGISCPPLPGDQVLIVPQEGNVGCGVVVGGLYSNMVRPPNANPGEMVIRHASGRSLSFLNSGKIVIDGDLHVTGDVYDSVNSLRSLREHFNRHTHRIPNGQTTSPPLTLD